MSLKLGPGAKTVLMLAGLVIVVAGLKLAAPLFVPLVAAVFITVVSLPVVRWLLAKRVPRWAAILLAVLLDLVVLAGFAGLVGGSLNEFYDRVPYYQERLSELTVEAAAWVDQHGLHIEPSRIGSAVDQVQVMGVVADVFQRLTELASKALLVALLVLFMLFEAGPWRIKMAYVLHSPTQDLPRFANAAREVQTYLVVKSGLSVVTGGLCGTWVALCGVDFPLLWGLLAFLLNYIPTLGMFIATIPPVVVALIQFGPGSALLVLAGYGVINFTLGNFVEPRIMGRALGLSPLVVFLSMVFWGWLWGPIGALVAVPLTMVIKILLANTEDLRWAAVMLGSAEWFAQKRREWEDPFEAEKRRSQLPPEPAEGAEAPPVPRASSIPPEAEATAAETRASSAPPGPDEENPPLHTEDDYEGSGPRAIARSEGAEEAEPEHETFRSA
ncbi:MAG TPA: AI-2E family transporter [Sandaracinaceae bacterium LLY-WYZ-13_1]|nr:AI-2E family transporter [Sandaracinaceae bacterium LLY-WYZ-13_1]